MKHTLLLCLIVSSATIFAYDENIAMQLETQKTDITVTDEIGNQEQLATAEESVVKPQVKSKSPMKFALGLAPAFAATGFATATGLHFFAKAYKSYASDKYVDWNNALAGTALLYVAGYIQKKMFDEIKN